MGGRKDDFETKQIDWELKRNVLNVRNLNINGQKYDLPFNQYHNSATYLLLFPFYPKPPKNKQAQIKLYNERKQS